MNRNNTDIDTAALAVLRSTGINILEAAILARDALEAGRGRVRRARKCLAAGADMLKQQERTVSFEKAAAVGMMLYAGIRPHEVARLTWEQVDLRERAIYILPRHSKTGGARRVTIHRPLLRILRAHKRADGERICPANWLQHWREVRRASGWGGGRKWPQDALRHTFASYHLSHFRSYAELQVEIGHRDATLLRTRYVDQRGVQGAARFWLAA